MATGTKVIRCIRCGEPIQTENKTNPGYVSPVTFAKANPLDPIYCERCYQDVLEASKIEEDIAIDERIYEVLDDAIKRKSLIIWVVDLISFNGLLPNELVSRLKNNPVIVVGTKKDFFPKPFNEKQVKLFLEYSFKQAGIKPLDIIPMEAKNNNEVLSTIERIKKQYTNIDTLDIYLIGSEGSGKTTLINSFLKNFENTSNRIIARIDYKNTGIKLLETPLSNRKTLYELPGYSNNQSILARVEKSIHKYIIPKKTLKMYMTPLRETNALLFGALCAFEVIKGESTIYKFYCAETIEIRRTVVKNVRKAIMTNKINEVYRPVSDRLHSFLDYDYVEFKIEKDNKMHEIAIEGFGFVTFKGIGQIIWAIVPAGTAINEGINRY